MKAGAWKWCRLLCRTLALFSIAFGLTAAIPEPGLVLFGVVSRVEGGQTNRVTTGTLECRVTPLGGTAITVRTNLQNINDQFSYVLIVPFETRLAGMTPSEGVLALQPAGATYSLSITVNGSPTRTVAAEANVFSFGAMDRGKLERVDLIFTTQPADLDGNGLPDDWELAHFGHVGVDPSADSDHDGLSNLQEWVAGTSPLDSQSAFRFISVSPEDQPGLIVRWASAEGRQYTLLRSADLFERYSVIQSNLVATPPVNTFRDALPDSSGTWFYKLRIENP